MPKATEADREHFRRVAEASARINRERAADSAAQDPGAKIMEALRLSNLMLRMGTGKTRAKPDKHAFSLRKRWLEAESRKRHAGDRA